MTRLSQGWRNVSHFNRFPSGNQSSCENKPQLPSDPCQLLLVPSENTLLIYSPSCRTQLTHLSITENNFTYWQFLFIFLLIGCWEISNCTSLDGQAERREPNPVMNTRAEEQTTGKKINTNWSQSIQVPPRLIKTARIFKCIWGDRDETCCRSDYRGESSFIYKTHMERNSPSLQSMLRILIKHSCQTPLAYV